MKNFISTLNIRRDKWLYLMVLFPIIWFIIFAYTPMFGIAIAFRRFTPGMSFFAFDNFVGFDNFARLFADAFFWRAFRNTVIISILRIAVCLPAAIILAVLLTEVRNRFFRQVVQTVTYIPHFLSWVVVAAFFITFLHPERGINHLLEAHGLSIITLTNRDIFRYILVSADMWKDMGMNSVIFMAAIMGVNPSLHESAAIDGAGRVKRIFFITLPCIRNTILTVFVIWVGIIINVGFDQVFNMYNPAVFETGDIISTYVFRVAFSGGTQFGFATAAGLFQSVIALFLITMANLFARGIGEEIVF